MSFTFTVTAADWGRVAPEIVLAVFALLLMLVDLVLPDKTGKGGNFLVLPLLSLVGLLGAFAATIVLFAVGEYQPAFNHMIGSDSG